MQSDPNTRQRLLAPIRWIIENFGEGEWRELGMLTGHYDLIDGHPRLLRSLSFGDHDYRGHAIKVINDIVNTDPRNLQIIENYVASHWTESGANVSSVDNIENRIVFSPIVFRKPDVRLERNLVSVMIPFYPTFEQVFVSITRAANQLRLRCLRVSDIWEESPVIQDIFSLIYRSFIVVVDFSGKNANVFYEAGSAHTLGKHVVPITQSNDDIPFDLRHHRYLLYLNNNEGRMGLEQQLVERFRYLSSAV
jgi:AbiJ N-terminal domain 5